MLFTSSREEEDSKGHWRKRKSSRNPPDYLRGLRLLCALSLFYQYPFGTVEAFWRPYYPLSSSVTLWHGEKTRTRIITTTTVPIRSTMTKSLLILCMGKGDGKKKRKKKSTSSITAHTAATPAAPRVTSDSNIPVRRQIAWANINKEFRKQQQTSFRQTNTKVERTKYRKLVNETELEETLEYRRRNRDPDWDEVLSAGNATQAPVLLVDAYNIIYKWARLRKHMRKGDIAHARRLLISDLEDLASWKHWDIECVFDGGGRDMGRVQAETSQFGIKVVYTGSGVETADAYVAQTSREMGKTNSMVIVATDDAMIRSSVTMGSSSNVLYMSADRLISELKAVRQGISYRVEVAVAKLNGHGVRPEALRTRETADLLFNVGAVVIEDRRELKKKRKQDNESSVEDVSIDSDCSRKLLTGGTDENGIPLWAKLPNRTSVSR